MIKSGATTHEQENIMLTRPSFRLWLVSLSLLLTAALCCARPYTPKPGSAERKAILDALRVPIQREARQPIVFYNVEIRVEKGWAWVLAVSKDKSGKKLPLGDLMTQGLLHKVKGRWRVEHWGVSGDISVACAAAKAYPQAPRSIFGGVLSGC
jgi:hypothetical protein